MRTYTKQLQQLKDDAVNSIITYANMLGDEDSGIKYITITDHLYKYTLCTGSKIEKVGLVIKDDKGEVHTLYSLVLEVLLDVADHITETSQVKMREFLDKCREGGK